MYTSHWRALIIGGISVGLACATVGRSDESTAQSTAAEWNQVVDRAIAYLRKTQREDGSWNDNNTPGFTGIVVTGLLNSGRISAKDPMMDRALHYIEAQVNPQAGHIAGPKPDIHLENYVTSVNVMALVAAHRADKYRKIIGDATAFLKKLQWDEGRKTSQNDPSYGGFGYDHSAHPDMSNTQFALEALHDAGIPRDDPSLQRALTFVSRCQNFKSEYNDQPWAGKINDGSFIYSPASGGKTKIPHASAETGLPGYGSMTYAGIKSMIYCGATKDDPRIRRAYAWIQKHYTVDANAGMPQGMEHQGQYYYYHTMAKALSVLGVDDVTDAHGKKHNWRAELTHALAVRQHPDGSWKNPVTAWMEGQPDLATGYALMALAYCKPAAGK